MVVLGWLRCQKVTSSHKFLYEEGKFKCTLLNALVRERESYLNTLYRIISK
jgi:hypothetical protein